MQCGIEFDAIKQHIQYDNHLSPWSAFLTIVSCFAHIVNLACKAVLTAITNIDYANDDADFIRGSSLRCQIFSEILESLHDVDNLQLLQDVITCWSSTLLMIECVLYLCPMINSFLSSQDFPEFHKYQLSSTEWGALSDFKNILAVPHVFQQILSCEKMPCISDTIPAFEVMQFTWEELQKEMPHATDIIAKGLEKLAEYHGRVNDVPIYSLAIHRSFSSFQFFAYTFAVIHPAYKLQWFQKNLPGEVLEVKNLFINMVQGSCFIYC
ncbi:hypothetical protein ARMGADRAFT_948805 [Armillaria gallica]|uniref:Uncharacterized protein n=1 Tax=Armillaria gallica TaxID=47427 RepID=A0A2H3CIB6_ARMGA|nr:hypothetical protein ARMGADRAFT_948805 [Armillaria gallica]